MDKRLDDLIEKIHQAFAAVPHPGDQNIIAGDGDHFNVCDECRELRDYFIGKTRESFINDKEAYRQLINAFSFFTLAGWQYYLPIYLIRCLQEHRLRFDDFWHHDEPIVKDEFWPERVNYLNSEQCAVVVHYLDYVCQKNESTTDNDGCCMRVLNWWREHYQQKV